MKRSQVLSKQSGSTLRSSTLRSSTALAASTAVLLAAFLNACSRLGSPGASTGDISGAQLSQQSWARNSGATSASSHESAKLSAPSPWRYHPLRKAPRAARMDWPSGGSLEVDEAGSRWLVMVGKEPQVGAYGAPEPLVGFVHEERQRFGAVGRSGSVYFFDEALGPFVDTRTPNVPLVQSVVSDGLIYGVTGSGVLYRSEDAGLHYEALQTPGQVTDVAASEAGELYVLLTPERWAISSDRGSSFRVLDVASVGPLSFSRTKSGEVLVQGLLANRLLKPQGWATPSAQTTRVEKDYALPTFARLQPLEQRHALMAGGEFLSLVGDKDDTSFLAWTGSPYERLEESHVARPPGCVHHRLIGRPQQAVVVCENRGGTSPTVRLYRYDAVARRLEPLQASLAEKSAAEPAVLRGQLRQIFGDVARDGTVNLAGMCAPHAAEKGCDPYGILSLSADGTLLHRQLPGAVTARDLRVGRAGQLWAVGLREKDEHIVLYTFRPNQPLPDVVDLTDFAPEFWMEQSGTIELLPGDDDFLSVVTAANGTLRIVAIDPEGEPVHFSMAPSGAAALHGAGRNLAAVNTRTDTFWVSDTFGLAFHEEALPRSLCEGKDECETNVICDATGCLVADELARVGYAKPQHTVSGDGTLLANKQGERRTLPGFSCQPAPGQWTELPGLVAIPEARDAFLGDAVWSGVIDEADRAAATAVSASLVSTQIDRRILLAPVSDPERYAVTVTQQVEGSAALRVRLPSKAGGLSGPVEIAWDNRLEDVVGQGSVNGEARDVRYGYRSALSKGAEPAMLSVAGRGIHVQLNARADTVFLELPEGASQPVAHAVAALHWPAFNPALPLASELGQSAREERIYRAGNSSGLLLLAESRLVVRSMQTSTGQIQYTPMLLAPLREPGRGLVSRVSLAYRGKQVGFLTLNADWSTSQVRAFFVGLGSDVPFETAVPVPLLQDLPARPQACSSQQRAQTPRVVAPGLDGTERIVKINGLEKTDIALFSKEAVLFGTLEQPCVAAFDAHSGSSFDSEPEYYAIVSAESGQVSWLFRQGYDSNDEQVISAHPMLCSMDAAEGNRDPSPSVSK